MMGGQQHSTPGPSGGWGGANPGFNPTGGIWDFNPQVIAGLSPLEQYGLSLAGGLPGVGSDAYGAAQSGLQGLLGGQLPWQTNAMVGQAQNLGDIGNYGHQAMSLFGQIPSAANRQVTGENIEQNPAYQAALANIQGSINPGVQNAAVASGLGRSQPALSAQASAGAQYMLPVIQGILAQEERGIDRSLGGLQAAAGGLLGGAGMEQQGRFAGVNALGQAGQMANANQQAGIQGMMNLGNTQQQNMINAISTMMGTGALPRELDQQQNDAMYQEWMRLMGTGENAVMTPMQMIGGLLGSSSTSEKK
jgi:hypothetical protein